MLPCEGSQLEGKVPIDNRKLRVATAPGGVSASGDQGVPLPDLLAEDGQQYAVKRGQQRDSAGAAKFLPEKVRTRYSPRLIFRAKWSELEKLHLGFC